MFLRFLRNFGTSREKAVKEDVRENAWSLLEEEILCETFRNYPILYDKTHKGQPRSQRIFWLIALETRLHKRL